MILCMLHKKCYVVTSECYLYQYFCIKTLKCSLTFGQNKKNLLFSILSLYIVILETFHRNGQVVLSELSVSFQMSSVLFFLSFPSDNSARLCQHRVSTSSTSDCGKTLFTIYRARGGAASRSQKMKFELQIQREGYS